ncbi:integrase [Paenibacillus sp. W4I10]|uniref:tyrosine-type recombinase/integrase n=1 Tax=Paenibacillus sp. W4I10 TaxID=3042298 RepID=UPI00277F91D6|nr:site-specific integrase [Paenibacillus sp. W4I10]MDQ0719753.1 integrase [Paenibacillus sp. W4I10]
MPYFYKVEANNKQGYKWVCVGDAQPDPYTGKRKQISRRGDTKKEALARVNKVIGDLNSYGIDAQKNKKITFEMVAKEWLSTYSKGRIKQRTLDQRESTINALCKYLAQVKIEKITHQQYQDILNDYDNKGYSTSAIITLNSVANMIFKHAIKNKMRQDNPCFGAIIPKKTRTVEEIENDLIAEKYFEKNELIEFLDATKKHGQYQDLEMFYLLTFSGMRSGEMCALKWKDINFETNEIRITKTIYSKNDNRDNYLITPPKTEGSIRTIEIDSDIMRLLEKHRANQKNIMNSSDSNFVFCRKNRYPFFPKIILEHMKKILLHTTISKPATPHIFRHTHISMLAEAGADLKSTMGRVGHTNAKTTLQVYTHVTDKMKKDTSNKIKIHYADILGSTKSQEK